MAASSSRCTTCGCRWTTGPSARPTPATATAYRYTAENIDLVRKNLGDPNAVVHAIGGIGDTTTAADIDGYYRASAERGAIGGGLYDYRTTGDSLWDGLKRFRV